MKQIYVADLYAGQNFEGVDFGIAAVKRLQDKRGNDYIDLELVDKTGAVRAKVWSETLQRLDDSLIEPGAIAQITGAVSEFRGELQITVNELVVDPESNKRDLSEFMQTSDRTRQELEAGVNEFISSIKTPELKQLLEAFLEDHADAFYTSPAAKKNHHHYLGGLAEHVFEMLTISESLKTLYPQVNYDLVIAGVILHDAAKITELSRKGFAVEYTRPGKLLGHITLGVLLVKEYHKKLVAAGAYGDPVLAEALVEQLQHIVAAHHGELEFGSPVRPITLEAEVVSRLDDVSWSLRAFTRVIGEATSKLDSGSAEFTHRDYGLGREILIPQPDLTVAGASSSKSPKELEDQYFQDQHPKDQQELI